MGRRLTSTMKSFLKISRREAWLSTPAGNRFPASGLGASMYVNFCLVMPFSAASSSLCLMCSSAFSIKRLLAFALQICCCRWLRAAVFLNCPARVRTMSFQKAQAVCEARINAGKLKVDSLIQDAEDKGKLTFVLSLTTTECTTEQKEEVLLYARGRGLTVEGTKKRHRYLCSLEEQGGPQEASASACSSREAGPMPPAKRTRRAATVLCSE